MSRTITMFSCSSSNRASPTASSRVMAYPWVRKPIARATRSGVLTRPSRVGSSPMRASWSRTISAYAVMADSSPTCSAAGSATVRGSAMMSLLAGVLDIVVGGLPEDEPREAGRRDRGRELAPDGDDDVLGGGNHALHEVHVEIEVAVVHAVEHTLGDDLLQGSKVEDIPGTRFDWSAHADVQRVVVSVPVGVVAASEQPLVLLIGERRVVDPVRGIELQAARDGYVWHGKVSWLAGTKG